MATINDAGNIKVGNIKVKRFSQEHKDLAINNPTLRDHKNWGKFYDEATNTFRGRNTKAYVNLLKQAEINPPDGTFFNVMNLRRARREVNTDNTITRNNYIAPRPILSHNITAEEINDANLVGKLLYDHDIDGDVKILYLVDQAPAESGAIQSYHVPARTNQMDQLKWFINTRKTNDWLIESGITVFSYNQPGQVFEVEGEEFQAPREEILQKLVFMRPNNIEENLLTQVYREGESNCFLQPILNWVESKIEVVKDDRHYQTMKTRVEDYMVEFPNGVPEDEIQDISNTLRLKFEVVNLLGDIYQVYKPEGQIRRTFRFMNTRQNHVDVFLDNNYSNAVEIDKETMDQMKKDLKEEGRFYTYTLYNNDLYSIRTNEQIYLKTDRYKEVCKMMEEENNLKRFRIDYFKHKELSDYLKAGYKVDGTVDYQEKMEDESYGHIDMKNAYAKYKDCSFYEGFPTLITDWRKANMIQEIGYYEAYDFDLSNVNQNTRTHLETLKITKEGIYPSPQLKFYEELGVDFKIKSRATSDISFDMTMIDEMFEKNERNSKFYALHAGKLGCVVKEKTEWMDCNQEFARHLMAVHPEATIRHYPDETVSITTKPSTAYHNLPIAGFITAYARIQILQQLLKFPAENVLRVNLDGIFYKNFNPELNENFREKESPYHRKNDYNFGYSSTERFDGEITGEIRNLSRVSSHWGAGGSGKTTINIKDQGFTNVLFVAPSWKLATDKLLEHNVRSTVYERLLGVQCRNEYIDKPPAVIIADEISQITNERRDMILKQYPYSKIIFCGDVDEEGICYQNPPIEGKSMDLIGEKIEYTNNYRCQDDELKRRLTSLRAAMKRQLPSEVMNKFHQHKFKDRIIKKEDLFYEIQDYIVCSKRRCKFCKKEDCDHKDNDNFVKEWTDKYRGTFGDKEKYLITKTQFGSKDKEKVKGNIVITDEKLDNAEVRHAFTNHAVQGITVENERVIIDCRKLFVSQMPYVAVSRARRLDQIFLIV